MRFALVALFAAASGWFGGPLVQGQIYFSEDFESLTLGPPVNETLPQDNLVPEAWSPDGPEGWTVDRSGVPAGGVTEWRGWTFTDPIWWNSVAGQGRDIFADPVSQGFVIAVADGDEWDDAVHDPGDMVSFLSTPPLSLSGVSPGDELFFDSSWYPDAQQVGTLTASFDGGAPVELFRWESNAYLDEAQTIENPNYKPDAGIEQVALPIEFPGGAQEVVFNFGYTGGNNWWWAIDNLEFGDYLEDFESVQLGPNVMEGRASGLPFDPNATWTPDPPDGWTSNREDVIGYDDDTLAVEEWEGWSFANKDFWIMVADDQERSTFTKGEGTIAIADPDEWDDLGSPSSPDDYGFEAEMKTSAFSIEGAEPGSLTIEFDSSFRPWFEMTGLVSVSYDGGPFEDVLTLIQTDEYPESDLSRADEHVTIPLDNPAGASTMQIAFFLGEAGNDWWWAFDNLVVSAGGGVTLPGDYNSDGVVDTDDADLQAQAMNTPTPDLGIFDENGDGMVDDGDRIIWVQDHANTWFGDANFDGVFSTDDLVAVFAAGKYETSQAAVWAEGDWTGDLVFDSGDLVAAFSDGGFELGPRGAVSAVPEPSAIVLGLLGCLALVRRRR